MPFTGRVFRRPFSMSPTSLHHLVNIGCAVMALSIAAVVPLAYATQRPALADWWLVLAICTALGGLAGFQLRRRALKIVDAAERAHSAEKEAVSLRFDTAINNMSQGLCFFDGKQRLIVSNHRYAEMYGLTQQQVWPGTHLRDIVDHRYRVGSCPAMTPEQYLVWRGSIAVLTRPSETVTELQDGRIFSIRHQPMPDGGWVATHEDITQQRRTQAQIERLAKSDSLTTLPNRVHFMERLAELLRPDSGETPMALLFIDLDRFKAVNDTLGHPVGDGLLQAAALRLAACVRQGDLVARLGGDEFAILQVGAPQPAAAAALADRLVRDIATPFDISGCRVSVGVSIGIALAPSDSVQADELLRQADVALYKAKAAGRGGYQFHRGFDHESHRESHHESHHDGATV